MSFLEISQGDSPLVLGLPHTGTELPDDIASRLNETGRALADTDWHVHKLYEGLVPGVTRVRTRIHRYAVDVNRDPKGVSLYPGQNTTGLCPLTDFNGIEIYRSDSAPDEVDVEIRRQTYHAPYHAALSAELDRVKAMHGFVILYDCHSIRSKVPFLFDGTLPVFNIGTNGGTTCHNQIAGRVIDCCTQAADYSSVVDGRFKGGWTTRHYGRPADGLHAIQMELAQCSYMQERAPWTYDPEKANRLRAHLKTILEALIEWRPS
ncbi:N-formylglutamate deformylase [Pseudovibrio sp. SPO723]|uniref:N-formylglutamate deformylase n=1 Tax=Nesiotobacter zosterae TaxID=392721 RepID=UPI0029C4DA3A|nr:N-formylglutamate deformylase [Pseudovibrio sp. SPO723]MDX5594290.1 N-formylglutamate deformylase [Pseudovibrio sp. SPO723]